MSGSAPDEVRAGSSSRGSTLLEVLIAGTLLAMTLLGVCTMFVTGYSDISKSGRTTMGITGARQVLEDLRSIPFDNLINVNGFDTDDPSSVPDDGPEREIARRWRYALAGEGAGWDFTQTERQQWTRLLSEGQVFGGTGSIEVVPQSTSLMLLTVRVSVPGRWSRIEWSTLVARR